MRQTVLNHKTSYQLECSIVGSHYVYCRTHSKSTMLCSCACMCLGSAATIQNMKISLSDRSLYQTPSTTGSTWKLAPQFAMQRARRLLPFVSPKMCVQVSKMEEWFTWRNGVQHVKDMLACITHRQVHGRRNVRVYQMQYLPPLSSYCSVYVHLRR